MKYLKFIANVSFFRGQDTKRGSRKKLKIFSSSWPGSRVRQCYVYFEGQFENTFFQPDAEQTKEPAKNKFWSNFKYLVNKQLQYSK